MRLLRARPEVRLSLSVKPPPTITVCRRTTAKRTCTKCRLIQICTSGYRPGHPTPIGPAAFPLWPTRRRTLLGAAATRKRTWLSRRIPSSKTTTLQLRPTAPVSGHPPSLLRRDGHRRPPAPPPMTITTSKTPLIVARASLPPPPPPPPLGGCLRCLLRLPAVPLMTMALFREQRITLDP